MTRTSGHRGSGVRLTSRTRAGRRSAFWIGGLLALWLAPATIFAQVADNAPPDVRRPYRGLYGQPAGSGLGQSLDVTASVFGAYDDDAYADEGAVQNPAVRRGGVYVGTQAALVYGRNTRKLGFGLESGVGLTRHGDPSQVLALYRAGATLGLTIKRHTQLTFGETFVYAPEFQLGLFVNPQDPGAFADPFSNVSSDLGVFSQSSYRTTTSLGVTHTLSRRSNLDGFYGLSTATYSGAGANYNSQSGGLRYSYRLTRNASLRVGYGYGVGRYSSATLERGGVHNIDVGVDYNRALSFSRRTSFSFTTGSAAFASNQAGLPGQNRGLNYALLGTASLNHEFGRTWAAAVSYRRSLDFHEGFADPFLAHALTAGVGGLISRRLTSNSSLSLGRGLAGVGTSNSFDSISATTGVNYGLTRYLAAYASYVYYNFNFANAVAIDPRLPQSLERQGIRFGLSTTLPLIRQEQHR